MVKRIKQGDITFIPADFLMQSNYYNHEQDQERQMELCKKIEEHTY